MTLDRKGGEVGQDLGRASDRSPCGILFQQVIAMKKKRTVNKLSGQVGGDENDNDVWSCFVV